MPENRPAAEKNLGVFFNGPVDGGGGFVIPMEPLTVGPGKAGPEDDWRMPVGPTQSGGAHDLEPGPPAGVIIEPTRD